MCLLSQPLFLATIPIAGSGGSCSTRPDGQSGGRLKFVVSGLEAQLSFLYIVRCLQPMTGLVCASYNQVRCLAIAVDGAGLHTEDWHTQSLIWQQF